MLKNDGMELFLKEMSGERGVFLTYEKVKVTQEFAIYKGEEDNSRGKFFNGLTKEQKEAFNQYEGARAFTERLIQHHLYIQGLKDGMALANLP